MIDRKVRATKLAYLSVWISMCIAETAGVNVPYGILEALYIKHVLCALPGMQADFYFGCKCHLLLLRKDPKVNIFMKGLAQTGFTRFV